MGATQAEILVYQGRYREALAVLDSMPEEAALPERAGIPARFRTAIFASMGSADLAWNASRKLVESSGGVDLVPVDLALARDRDHAAEAARLLVPGSRQLGFYQAVAAWRAGRLDEAASRLQAISKGKYAPDRAQATALLGELEAGRGRDAPAIENLEHYRTSGARQSGARAALLLPRTLLLLAQAYERTGDQVRARERVDELLRMWKGADLDLAPLREARSLQARLKDAPPERASK
jgi:tetratricopeptide (TPR) repeat protein